jgi:guanylate kinase
LNRISGVTQIFVFPAASCPVYSLSAMPIPTTKPGQLFVISAPSGAGKTSLVKALRERLPALRVSTSHTTRPPRPNEQNGREYYFVSNTEFNALVAAGAFLEHARVFDNQYGTSQHQLTEKLAQGSNVILEIDWQGARQVRHALPGCQTIFILPPSRQALRERLTTRQTDSAAVIERRLADAVSDMSHCHEFDYIVVNDQFNQAVDELAAILAGQGQALGARRPALAAVLANLL